ncbi:uncharacterized protein BDZ83DRAFT_623475 [Colletotrichum acutatum]|uniref:Uncharacterized protein n=1 Tax=Glomerella acutata TaxID=27357 RepID=A0AAD8UM00_GLOAC|nr:uncharacterized protein BDZ83DRAFT_623475 [Colletotrichum acutatum]KAK1724249.1 hypothetical protein BDZ83DRAFT_623475 [Colletotrichum acutatum]
MPIASLAFLNRLSCSFFGRVALFGLTALPCRVCLTLWFPAPRFPAGSRRLKVAKDARAWKGLGICLFGSDGDDNGDEVICFW